MRQHHKRGQSDENHQRHGDAVERHENRIASQNLCAPSCKRRCEILRPHEKADGSHENASYVPTVPEVLRGTWHHQMLRPGMRDSGEHWAHATPRMPLTNTNAATMVKAIIMAGVR